jgi:3-oxoacyl-[acyl-carrier protein] reductase
MTKSLQEKIVLVTGAARGLGCAISLAMASKGATVIATDINEKDVTKTAEELIKHTSSSISSKADMADIKDLENLVESVIRQFGRIDILVNNAGICPRTSFDMITEKEWDNVLDINLKGVFFLSQMVISHMKEKHYGRIINISSAAGKIGGLQVGAHYSASKAAIICLTKTMALYGAGYGINANAVCPGVMDTEMTTSLPEEMIGNYLKKIPLGRMGTADDIAGAVLFLVSKTGDYITGEILDVNGGFIMD